jgi:osmotically-inducible protein OsmY
MARYDRGGYGDPRGAGEPFWEWGGGRSGGWGGGPDDWDSRVGNGSHGVEGIYGPARYGLGPYHERLRTRRRPDKEIRDDVKESLFYDTWVDADAVKVEVKDGIVTLTGELPDYDEIRYATDDAWDVDGVLGVRSELRVRGQ